MLATDGTWPEQDSASSAFRALARPVLIGSLALLLALGAFLAARRMSGALAAPLAPLPLVATALLVLLTATILRLRLRFTTTQWLPPLAIALFAIGCSFPGERAIDWLVWLTVAAVYGVVPMAPARRSSPAIGYEASEASDTLLQQVSRSRTTEGVDFVHGTLTAEFAAGERSATLHVAFCPPFEYVPSIEAEAVDGDDCDVKIAQVLHQGARLEVRLPRASTAPQRIRIEFAATETPPFEA